MSKPVRLLEMAKIGMTSHVREWESGDEGDKAVKGAIAYIEKHGEQDANLRHCPRTIASAGAGLG